MRDLVEPKLLEPGPTELEVRALRDDAWITFRLEWADTTAEKVVGPGRPSDAVAVELPTTLTADVPDPAMGMRGAPVNIAYWKAAWQETADPVAALRPNLAVDHYPAAAAPSAKRADMERAYAPARAAGNPVTGRQGSAVQDLIAEGAGTITAASAQTSVGRGTWNAGRWSVTIARPVVATALPGDGRRGYVAFAVWDGTRGHAGARKMRSVWLPLIDEAKK